MPPNDRKISLKAVLALLFYLIIPLAAIYVIITTYPELTTGRYERMVYWFVPLALILVIISQLCLKYPRGDDRRFILDMAYMICTMLWLFAFLGGGVSITETWGDYHFTIHLWKYVALIGAVTIFNMGYFFLEWRVYKNDVEAVSVSTGNQ